MTEIIRIPAFKDNYIWLLTHKETNSAIVVDPGEADGVLETLAQKNLTLKAILITHHHWDHSGGIEKLLQHYPVPVYGPKEDIKHLTHTMSEPEYLKIEDLPFEFKILSIPGHTLHHIAYYNYQAGLVLCGDTLFTGGCGKIFEGTREQMFHSIQKLKHLPENTLIYCGHEYTESNLKFASIVEPNNVLLKQRIEAVKTKRANHEATVPAPLSIELETNPFLRTHVDDVINAAKAYSKKDNLTEVEVFGIIREWKNNL